MNPGIEEPLCCLFSNDPSSAPSGLSVFSQSEVQMAGIVWRAGFCTLIHDLVQNTTMFLKIDVSQNVILLCCFYTPLVYMCYYLQ